MGNKIIGFITILAVSAILLSACDSTNAQAPLTGTSWTLVSYGPESGQTPAAQGVETSLNFGKDGKVSGSLGCNQFGGDYSLKDGKLVFGMLVSTMMACPEPQMTQESTSFKVLNGTINYAVKDRTLTLYAADNTVMLTLSQK